MLELLRVMGPMLFLMLIPVWIPVATVSLGAVRDRLTARD